MNFGSIGDSVAALFIGLIVVGSIGLIAIGYCIGHFAGLWS